MYKNITEQRIVNRLKLLVIVYAKLINKIYVPRRSH